MFNKPESILIYLSIKGLRIKSKDQDRQVNFDSKTINYLEVIDPINYKEFIKQQLDLKYFFNKHVVILLEDSVLFTKEFVTLINIVDDNLFNEYKDLIPLPLEKVEYRTNHTDGSSKIYVTNKEIYEPIIKVLLNLNCIMEGIYPKTELEKRLKEKESIQNIEEQKLAKYINKYKEDIENLNFNQQLTFTPRRVRILTLLLLLVLSISITSVIIINRNKQEKEQDIINNLNTTENTILLNKEKLIGNINEIDQEIPENEQNIQSEEENKKNFSEIKIRVLNASGVAGEATKVKNLFIQAGNTNIEVGNEPITNEGYTKVIYKTTKAISVKELVLSSMKSYFSNFNEVEEITDTDTEDVLIVTGIAK